jgi:nucleotide-binding universal stress UspA family protein
MTQSKIIIASDLGETTLPVISEGVELARQTGASAYIVNVVDNTLQYANLMPGFSAYGNWEEFKEYATKALIDETKGFDDIEMKIIVKIGEPKTEIIDLVKHLSPAYLVIGAHGRTGLAHMVMGSNVEYLIRHSSVPVIVVPHKNKSEKNQ